MLNPENSDNDIRDLLGRYATGSLTDEEQKRLFDAALDDQELFDELAREDDIKQLFAEPGARDRMIHALRPAEPPRRKMPWILALAPVVALSAVLIVVLLRPVPKPTQEVAVAKPPVPQAVATVEPPASQPAPSGAPSAPVKAKSLDQPLRDEPRKEAVKKVAESENAVKQDAAEKTADQKDAGKAADQVAPAAAPPPAPVKSEVASSQVQVQAQSPQVQQVQVQAAQQNAPSGPKQDVVAAPRAMAAGKVSASRLFAPAFGFHYSLETEGHLKIIPGADGYLSAATSDGKSLYGPQRSAAGIVVDLTLPESAASVTVTFSSTASPVRTTPMRRKGPSGTVQGQADLAVEIEIKPR